MMRDPYTEQPAAEPQYFFNLNTNRLFTRNEQNYINRLGRDNLNTLGDMSLLDIYLSNGHVVEPHYHQNASELVYCISGAAEVSLINPFTNERTTVRIMPGEVASVPQGWWHWEIAQENNTHLLAMFDAPYPEYILYSDLLAKTPADVMAQTYCVDPETWEEAIAPLQGETIIIGPTDACAQQQQQQQVQGTMQQNNKPAQPQSLPYHEPYYVYPYQRYPYY
ncbi:Cupin [Salibacterium qingdaonense]|uniref:Cupin n=2 Tax=Salibacterium qingdaonense TaxID=266892 RepID=A0A1I4N3H5_9BACI|nr:Cupin [Salibacterium qingdaonense]